MLRFPLGEMPKPAVRDLAREFGLSVADKHDSQDICFVPQGRYTDVIERLKPEAAEPGDIVHTDGRYLGRHTGVVRYTVGQRRGLGVSTGEPLYVVRIDAARRQVVVGPREALATQRVHLRDVNWIGDGALSDLAGDREVAVRVRSTRPPQAALLRVVGGEVEVELAEGEYGVSPGQACVIYDDASDRARVLGGGVIRSTLRPSLPASEQAESLKQDNAPRAASA